MLTEFVTPPLHLSSTREERADHVARRFSESIDTPSLAQPPATTIILPAKIPGTFWPILHPTLTTIPEGIAHASGTETENSRQD